MNRLFTAASTFGHSSRSSPDWLYETVVTGIAIDLQNPGEALPNIIGILLAAPRRIGTGLRIERHAAALLTAGTTPVVVTTTNLPGALAFSIPMEAAPQGSVYEKALDPARVILASAQNTATTIPSITLDVAAAAVVVAGSFFECIYIGPAAALGGFWS